MTVDCNEIDAATPHEPARYRVEPNERPSLAVVRAVATASGRDAAATGAETDALDPLAETIDPDALDDVFASQHARPEDAPLVEFSYCGYQVAVQGGKSVSVIVG